MAGLRKPGESPQPSPRPREAPESPAPSESPEWVAEAATETAGPGSETPDEGVAEATDVGTAATSGAADEARTTRTEKADPDSGTDPDESTSSESARGSGPRRKKLRGASEKPDTGDDVVGAAAPGTPPAGLRTTTPRSARGRMSVKRTYITAACLVVLAAVLATGAWFAASKYSSASAATGNSALIDVDETEQVKKAMSSAAEQLFSFDYRDIDETEEAADELLANSEVEKKYDMLMEEVKRLAPEQKAVVKVDATESAVVRLHDDQAKVIVYVDQTSKRKKSQERAAGGAALWLSAELQDDEWKVVGMDTYSSDESLGGDGDESDEQKKQDNGKDGTDKDGKDSDKNGKDGEADEDSQGDSGDESDRDEQGSDSEDSADSGGN